MLSRMTFVVAFLVSATSVSGKAAIASNQYSYDGLVIDHFLCTAEVLKVRSVDLSLGSSKG